jgi:hypothetical protein
MKPPHRVAPPYPPSFNLFPPKSTDLRLVYDSHRDASCGMQRVWVEKLKEWSLIKAEAAIALCFNTPRYLQQRKQLWRD